MLDTLIYVDTYALESLRSFFFPDTWGGRMLIAWLADIEWIVMALFLIALWLYGVKQKDATYKVHALNMFYMIAGGFAIYLVLNQFLEPRMRPEAVSQLPPLIKHIPDNSFPSGHAIFAASSTLAVHYFMRHRSLTLSVFLLGILMNLARVISGVHYPGDILAGYIIGIFGAYLTYRCLGWKFFRMWLNPFFLKLATYFKL